jgi:hypothetical protein
MDARPHPFRIWTHSAFTYIIWVVTFTFSDQKFYVYPFTEYSSGRHHGASCCYHRLRGKSQITEWYIVTRGNFGNDLCTRACTGGNE